MKILIANRGEIACRIALTCHELGVPSVAVFSDVDAGAPHTEACDESVAIGGASAYLDIEAILEAARSVSATAVHPGYGFLSQSPAFAQACADAGLCFIGPSPQAMRVLGDKRASRAAAEAAGVPVLPGSSACDSVESARKQADEIGYPVLLKAAGGGGGKGMRRVDGAEGIEAAFGAATREAEAAFADGRLLIEKYVHPARHVEVQILGDGAAVMALGERECSLQRRYQKIIEESPSPGIDSATREALCQHAVKLGEQVGYSGAGTVEFLVDAQGGMFFLEVNTRLQVEHPVTEVRCGLDIVAQQIRVAHGESLPPAPSFVGHAIEARLNAEDAFAGYLPQVGRIGLLKWPSFPWLRVESGVVEGSTISADYDSMIAKLVVFAPSREEATRRLMLALRETAVLGVETNREFLLRVLGSRFWQRGDTFTSTIESENFERVEIPSVVQDLIDRRLSANLGVRALSTEAARAADPFHTLKHFRVGA